MSEAKKCYEIYKSAFGESAEFDRLLFKKGFEFCRYLKVGKETAGLLFLLPCEIENGGKRYKASYLYAAATDEKYKNQGVMTKLLKSVCEKSDGIIFLKPASEGLINFYEKRGFVSFEATPRFNPQNRVIKGELFEKLALLCDKETESFCLMAYKDCKLSLSGLEFSDTMN